MKQGGGGGGWFPFQSTSTGLPTTCGHALLSQKPTDPSRELREVRRSNTGAAPTWEDALEVGAVGS